jgi:hypothetical protein
MVFEKTEEDPLSSVSALAIALVNLLIGFLEFTSFYLVIFILESYTMKKGVPRYLLYIDCLYIRQ